MDVYVRNEGYAADYASHTYFVPASYIGLHLFRREFCSIEALAVYAQEIIEPVFLP